MFLLTRCLNSLGNFRLIYICQIWQWTKILSPKVLNAYFQFIHHVREYDWSYPFLVSDNSYLWNFLQKSNFYYFSYMTAYGHIIGLYWDGINAATSVLCIGLLQCRSTWDWLHFPFFSLSPMFVVTLRAN